MGALRVTSSQLAATTKWSVCCREGGSSKLAQSGPNLRNIIALHFHYGLSQLMLYPVVCARTFQSARCELLVPNQHSPGE